MNRLRNSPKVYHTLYRLVGLGGWLARPARWADVGRFRRGFADHRVSDTPTAEQRDRLARIAAAYQKAKADQRDCPPIFQVGKMWQDFLNEDFRPLTSALTKGDLDAAHRVLNNLHRESCTKCLHTAMGAFEDSKTQWLFPFEYNRAWHGYYKVYLGEGGQPNELIYPNLGNPIGLTHGSSVLPLDGVRYHALALKLLKLFPTGPTTTITEIGGGIGAQAFALLSRRPSIAYTLFDIPEVLAISSYFLLNALPERTITLYGEAHTANQTPANASTWLLPNFEIANLPDSCIDLFLNCCSLAEMNAETADEYLRQIDRCGRRYFFHENHEARFTWNVDGKRIQNRIGPEIKPAGSAWRQVFREDRPFHTPGDDLFCRRENVGFHVYLYERS